ncbi:ABC transporter permease [Rhodococcus erythropolis]|uniref:ABC transporter permease n=1 Tax=Rhodococcus erythropolis TaxID=1833 RepID=UPI00210EAC93|nr:ABC transporter permease [Rhodococcus erythropolis]MCQ4127660.1 ABC transporter permease [Rhodococcus erythropolis]
MVIQQYRSRPQRIARAFTAPARWGSAVLHHTGHQVTFVVKALGAIPRTLISYPGEVSRVLNDIAWGGGKIVVGGGTMTVLLILGLATGASVGIEGFAALDMVGMGSLTGFISAYATTRELGPMIAAIGFAAQAGCRMTAEIGSMRISDEIEALEAMAVRPLPYIVTTRIIAGIAAIIPFYLITLILSYLAAAAVVTIVHGQSVGTYQHYFDTFLQPLDIFFSLIKASVFVLAVILIHAYQGYHATGGPEGVGRASGRSIRASLIVVVLLDTMLTLSLWGFDSGIRISG